MVTSTPRRARGRTLINVDPDQLIWVLLAHESTDRERQIDNQRSNLRAQVARIGGRIDREIPENAVVPDIDRAMRDPRTLGDLIDVVECTVFVASLMRRPPITGSSGDSSC